MSDGESKSGSQKRGHWFKEAKAKATALDALLEQHGVTSVEELNERLAGVTAPTATVEAPPATANVPIPTVTLYDASLDPLAWVHGEEEVWLVGTVWQLPGHTLPVPTGAEKKDLVEGFRAYTQDTWGMCPWKPRGRNEEERRNIEIMTRKHHKFRLTRHYAERVFASPWGPFPKTACVQPAHFEGRDYNGFPKGIKTPSSGDALTELLRFYLQKAAGSLWIDVAYHPHVDFQNPNPYGRNFERRGTPVLDPRTVIEATPEGDVRKEWGE